MIKGIIIGFVLAIVIVFAGVGYYFRSGMAPAAVSDPMMPFERQLAHMALDAHIDRDKVADSPIAADEKNLTEGAVVYRMNCASCHGLPDQPPSPYEKTMFPKPTALFRGKGVTDDSPGESYWKVANGIRLSGMPSFKNSLTETQQWQVSQLVAHANALPAPAKAALLDGPQPSAEKALPGNDAQASGGDPQGQANYLIRLAGKMMDDGDYGSARSYYESALKLAPSDAEARSGIDSANRALSRQSKQ